MLLRRSAIVQRLRKRFHAKDHVVLIVVPFLLTTMWLKRTFMLLTTTLDIAEKEAEYIDKIV
jgi:hypothetical protein